MITQLYDNDFNLYIDYDGLTTRSSSRCFFSNQEVSSSSKIQNLLGQWTGTYDVNQEKEDGCDESYRNDLASSNRYRETLYRTLDTLRQLNSDEPGKTLIRLFLVVRSNVLTEPNMEMSFLNVAKDVILHQNSSSSSNNNINNKIELKFYFLVANEMSGKPTHIYQPLENEEEKEEEEEEEEEEENTELYLKPISLVGTEDVTILLKSYPTMEAVLYPHPNLSTYMFLMSVLAWKRLQIGPPQDFINSRLMEDCVRRPVIVFHQPFAFKRILEDITASYSWESPQTNEFASMWVQKGAKYVEYLYSNCTAGFTPTYKSDVVVFQ